MICFLNYITIILALSYVRKGAADPQEVSISVLSGTTTNTTVSAEFKCHPTSGIVVKEITGRFNLTQTFIPCTGLKSLVQKYTFNMTSIGGKRQTLVIKDLKTVSLYINGEQIATQSGPIEGNTCRSGKVVLTHWFRSREPMSCSTPKGLTHIESPTSTLRIIGGNCESFCTGRFILDYKPGLKNSRLPGILMTPPKPIKHFTIRPFIKQFNPLSNIG